jgi:hypothetical protein
VVPAAPVTTTFWGRRGDRGGHQRDVQQPAVEEDAVAVQLEAVLLAGTHRAVADGAARRGRQHARGLPRGVGHDRGAGHGAGRPSELDGAGRAGGQRQRAHQRERPSGLTLAGVLVGERRPAAAGGVELRRHLGVARRTTIAGVEAQPAVGLAQAPVVELVPARGPGHAEVRVVPRGAYRVAGAERIADRPLAGHLVVLDGRAALTGVLVADRVIAGGTDAPADHDLELAALALGGGDGGRWRRAVIVGGIDAAGRDEHDQEQEQTNEGCWA